MSATPFIRIAEIEVDPEQLDAFISAVKAEMDESVRVEPGVLSLYAVADKDAPSRLRFFGIYTSEAAYEAHLESPHFKRYRMTTESMVRSRTLTETVPVHSSSQAGPVPRMDNVLVVVDDLEAVKAFFVDLGLELEGEATVEGESVDRLVALDGVRATIASLRTPDGHGRIELDKFHTPAAVRAEPVDVPVNALGIRRMMFAVDDLESILRRLRQHGAELIGDVVEYGDDYRLAYVRGPEGIIVALAESLD